jgi:hypothetical protein
MSDWWLDASNCSFGTMGSAGKRSVKNEQKKTANPLRNLDLIQAGYATSRVEKDRFMEKNDFLTGRCRSNGGSLASQKQAKFLDKIVSGTEDQHEKMVVYNMLKKREHGILAERKNCSDRWTDRLRNRRTKKGKAGQSKREDLLNSKLRRLKQRKASKNGLLGKTFDNMRKKSGKRSEYRSVTPTRSEIQRKVSEHLLRSKLSQNANQSFRSRDITEYDNSEDKENIGYFNKESKKQLAVRRKTLDEKIDLKQYPGRIIESTKPLKKKAKSKSELDSSFMKNRSNDTSPNRVYMTHNYIPKSTNQLRGMIDKKLEKFNKTMRAISHKKNNEPQDLDKFNKYKQKIRDVPKDSKKKEPWKDSLRSKKNQILEKMGLKERLTSPNRRATSRKRPRKKASLAIYGAMPKRDKKKKRNKSQPRNRSKNRVKSKSKSRNLRAKMSPDRMNTFENKVINRVKKGERRSLQPKGSESDVKMSKRNSKLGSRAQSKKSYHSYYDYLTSLKDRRKDCKSSDNISHENGRPSSALGDQNNREQELNMSNVNVNLNLNVSLNSSALIPSQPNENSSSAKIFATLQNPQVYKESDSHKPDDEVLLSLEEMPQPRRAQSLTAKTGNLKDKSRSTSSKKGSPKRSKIEAHPSYKSYFRVKPMSKIPGLIQTLDLCFLSKCGVKLHEIMENLNNGQSPYQSIRMYTDYAQDNKFDILSSMFDDSASRALFSKILKIERWSVILLFYFCVVYDQPQSFFKDIALSNKLAEMITEVFRNHNHLVNWVKILNKEYKVGWILNDMEMIYYDVGYDLVRLIIEIKSCCRIVTGIINQL